MNRRGFLRMGAVLAAPWFVPSSVFSNPPSDRLTHACIGVDGMGWSDLTNLASHPRVQIVAICDVDVARQARAAEKLPQARKYQDWRELLATESDRIDSVNVSVPDHMHAPISMTAIMKRKHVFCQKPLTHEISEARALRLAAEKMGVTTQMGNQIQSASVYRTAVRMIQDGLIGRVRAIHVWIGAKYSQPGRPTGADPVPASLDWDQWLGVAPSRPYKKDVYHPFHWRGWQDFGGGAMADFGCHILDTPFKALGLSAPKTVTAEVPVAWIDNPARRQESWPDSEVIQYVFPGTRLAAGDTLPVTWYDGDRRPQRELFGFADSTRKIPGGGALFLGEEGKLLLPHVGAPELLPGSGKPPVVREVEGFNHYHAYADACLGIGATGSSFSYAGPLTEATLLGTIANRFPGQTLQWDADQMRILNSPEANRLVTRTYREGWSVPQLG